MHKATDEQIVKLVDEVRDLDAQRAGAAMRLAYAVGDRDGAYRHMKEMYAQTEARIAAQSVCEMEKR